MKAVVLRSVVSAAPCFVARCAVAAFACALLFAAETSAQVVTQADSAPPAKYVPEEDRTKLALTKNVKDRVKLTLQLAEARLQNASAHTDAERFIEAGNELGIYQALINDVINHVKRMSSDNNRMRDTFKRIELSLRSHVPRLETLRRNTPSEEAIHVRDCIEFVREARTRALESFFDDDAVLRQPPEPASKEPKEAGAQKPLQDEPEKKLDEPRR